MAALRGEGGPAGVAPGARQQARPLRVQAVRTGNVVVVITVSMSELRNLRGMFSV